MDILDNDTLHDRLVGAAQSTCNIDKNYKYSLIFTKLACTIRGEKEAPTIDEEIESALEDLDKVVMLIEQQCFQLKLKKLKEEQLEMERQYRLDCDCHEVEFVLNSERDTIYSMVGLFKAYNNKIPESNVKEFYKKILMKLHPDKNASPDASKAFIKLRDEYKKYSANPYLYEKNVEAKLNPPKRTPLGGKRNPRTKKNAYGDTYVPPRNTYTYTGGFNDFFDGFNSSNSNNYYRPQHHEKKKEHRQKYTAKNE